MKNGDKKIYFILLLAAVFLTLAVGNITLADEKGLEIEYPKVPGAETPTIAKTPLPQYIKYVFNFGIWIAGFVAFLSLVYGGVRYLTSAGNPSSVGDAKDQMFAGILGLVILLSSYLILSNLNPQLLTLKVDLEQLDPAQQTFGVYLCSDSSETAKCVVFNDSSDTLPSQMENQVNYVRIKNTDTIIYGAILHSEKSRRGYCSKVLFNDGPTGMNVSSITVFKRSGESTGEGVTLYECKDYDTESITGKTLGLFGGYKCQKWGPYRDVWEYNLGEKGRSIKIEERGKYLAVLYQGSTTGICEVFTQSDPDLTGNYIAKCGTFPKMACFDWVTILPIR